MISQMRFSKWSSHLIKSYLVQMIETSLNVYNHYNYTYSMFHKLCKSGKAVKIGNDKSLKISDIWLNSYFEIIISVDLSD